MNKRGFTLVEILAVIAIIGILALLIVPNVIENYRMSSKYAMKTQENEVVDASKLFIEDFCRHPLSQNKGQCTVYSVSTSDTNLKYTCLNAIQTFKYIDPIVFQGSQCVGFVIYTNKYEEVKSYLQCGEKYSTEGIDTIKDSSNESVLELCGGNLDQVNYDSAETVVFRYENPSTNKKYETLKEALANVSNDQTIQVIRDATENDTSVLDSGKTGVKIDLNGHTISFTSNASLSNKGTLDIYNTASTPGKISGSYQQVLVNSGTLTLNGTSTSKKIIIEKTSLNNTAGAVYNGSSGTFTMNSNVEVNEIKGTHTSSGIYNTGTATIKGGTINSQRYGIDNSGTITISGGTINSEGFGLYNENNGQITISGSAARIKSNADLGVFNLGTLTMTNGTITGNGCGMDNRKTATISGGTMSGSCGVLNQSSTTLRISGSAQVIGSSSYGVSNYGATYVTGGTVKGPEGILNNGTLTIGTNDSSVSLASPVIQGTGTSNKYGVNNKTTFNYYDGIIKSASGSGTSINGTVTSKPSGYNIQKVMMSGTENAYLLKPGESVFTATFYYNSNANMGGFTPANTTVMCSTNGTSTCTVQIPDEVRTSKGRFNGQYRGVSNSPGNMNNSSLTIGANTQFFANYYSTVSITLYNSGATTRNLYRNEFFTGTSNMETRICDSLTSTSYSNITSGPVAFVGLSTGRDINVEYPTIQAASTTNYPAFYAVYRYNVTFVKGTGVSSIGASSGTCNFVATTPTCQVRLPSITPASGYAIAGWSPSNGANSGTMPNNMYNITSNNMTLYANGKATSGRLMAASGTSGTSSFLRTTVAKNKIEKITFATSTSGRTPNGSNCWDVSAENNGFVLAWSTDSDGDGLYEITIGASSGRVILSNGAYLFSYLSNLNTINSLQNVDFTYVNSTVEMFAYCTSLTTLDLRNVNTYNVRYMDRMFYGCSNLRTIIANSSFTTTQVTSSISMFENCFNIRGGMGTTYMTSPTDKTFAKIDGNAGIGYFTQG